MQHVLKVCTFDTCNESAQVGPFVVCFHLYIHLFIKKKYVTTLLQHVLLFVFYFFPFCTIC
jgi:hypothetical protein